MWKQVAMVSALAVTGAWAQGMAPRGGRLGMEFQGRIIGAQAGMPGRVVKNAPYSADIVSETSQTLSDGNRIRQSNTSHVYRDSEGRTRREESLGGVGSLGANTGGTQLVFINDPVAGSNYALDPSKKTANLSHWNRMGRPGPGGASGQTQLTRPAPNAAGRRPGMIGARGANRQNVKTESLGTQTIEGVAAQGTRTTLTIAAGAMGNDAPIQIVDERWYSADLQAVVLSKRSDPRSGEFVTKLVNINRAEPSANLFQVPSDFKVTEGRGNRMMPPRAGSQQQ